MFDERNIREFPSPLAPYPPGNPPIPPAEPAVVTIPGLNADRAFVIAVDHLRQLPVPQRNLLVGHLTELLQLRPVQIAAIALGVRPYLSLAQIAALCGRSERQIRRYKEAFRNALDTDEAKARFRRTCYLPVEIDD